MERDQMDHLFMDSSFIIALVRQGDEQHKRALELRENNRNKRTFVISDHVLGEVVTFLGKRDNKEIAYKVGIALLESSDVKVLYPDESELELSLEALKKLDGLSLCDALTAVLMNRHKINKVLSFDSDFDRFKNIERIF
jgi:predicted nucleic acid-binding protein